MKRLLVLAALACSSLMGMGGEEAQNPQPVTKPSVLVRAKVRCRTQNREAGASKFRGNRRVVKKALEITEWYVIPKEDKSK